MIKVSGEEIRQAAQEHEETCPKGMKDSFYYGFREGAKWMQKQLSIHAYDEKLKIKAHDASMKYYPKERESDDPEMDSIIRSVYMDGFIDCFNELNGDKE